VNEYILTFKLFYCTNLSYLPTNKQQMSLSLIGSVTIVCCMDEMIMMGMADIYMC